jgi:high-affinity K+ transport system ATPase subunit B
MRRSAGAGAAGLFRRGAADCWISVAGQGAGGAGEAAGAGGAGFAFAVAAGDARRIVDGVQTVVPLEEVRPGDSIVVLPGERFPVDATIVEGRTTVDESMLTGERRRWSARWAGACWPGR